jgi:hypothetical protein
MRSHYSVVVEQPTPKLHPDPLHIIVICPSVFILSYHQMHSCTGNALYLDLEATWFKSWSVYILFWFCTLIIVIK